MFILQFAQNPIAGFFFLISIIITVSVHEFAHAKTADYLGDPTADLAGRVTLDPRSHLDPIGSILFLLAGFGWGKPVPFDPYNLKNPIRDAAIISFAGPASNFVMAIAGAIILRLLALVEPTAITTIGSGFIQIFILVNIILGIFNMLPIAPLDGFKIVGGFLSEKLAVQWYSLERYGLLFLLFFIFPFAGGRSMLETFVRPVITYVTNLLIL